VITRLNVGGPAINAAILSTGLDPDRFETLLVAGTEAATEGNMLELGRLGVHPEVTRVTSLGREISPIDDLRALGSVISIARRFQPDIVHTHLAKAGTIGRIAARVVGARVVIHTYHGTVFRGYFGPRKSRAFIEIERALSHVTTRIVAITAGQRRDLIALGIGDERKVVEIPLGLPLAEFLDPLDRSSARAALQIDRDVPLIAIVARLVPVKDVSMFLKAMASVPSPAVALVVGDGFLRAELEAESVALGLSERCRFLGWRADVKSIYAAADVIALTSQNEGSPVSIIEAMAAGKAVVATAVGGVPDVVTDGSTGTLVPAGDAQAFSAAVRGLLADPLRRERLGAAARRAVYPAYDARRLIADMSSLYSSLV
jgi:glycosyltransferase involved in cell wall biosynthesis